jgi:PAS domain S-box-containing protein
MGFLYLFPIMLAAGFLPRWAIVALGIGCALLSERFSNLDPSDSTIRLMFEALALCGCGLFTSEVLRNRRLSLSSQERLRVLVETSPAAIVTIDERGFIELANLAATELMAPRDGHLIGYPIAAFLPELHHALRWEDRPQFRTAMQCRGHRGNGETFLADVWFSSYKDGVAPKLAAIIADVSEEQAHPPATNSIAFDQQERAQLTNRELDVLRLVVQGLANKELASRLEISESAVKNTLLRCAPADNSFGSRWNVTETSCKLRSPVQHQPWVDENRRESPKAVPPWFWRTGSRRGFARRSCERVPQLLSCRRSGSNGAFALIAAWCLCDT